MDRIAVLKEHLEASPGDAFLQHALALEYIKRGDDMTAKSLFEAILDKNPAYTGSYYHLGKLLERQGDEAGAIVVYEKGMEQARQAGEQHTYGELRSAYEELTL